MSIVCRPPFDQIEVGKVGVWNCGIVEVCTVGSDVGPGVV
jgi:hypothetical protein